MHIIGSVIRLRVLSSFSAANIIIFSDTFSRKGKKFIFFPEKIPFCILIAYRYSIPRPKSVSFAEIVSF